MSSYFQSFSCAAPNGKRYNSYKDKKLIVVHFESGDSGEVDTFLGMEPVYTDNSKGTKRLDYGARYNNVAVIRISVMKSNGEDFTVEEVRDFLRWTTGHRVISYLDLSDIVDGKEVIRASLLGRITSVYQQKLDARTVGFVIEHTSVSPYAYSPIKRTLCSFEQALSITNDNIMYKDEQRLTVTGDGVLINETDVAFDITNSGVTFVDNPSIFKINNDTDDLSDYIYVDTVFTNVDSDNLIIKNKTLYEESDGADGVTEITGVKDGEVITLSSGQFITSSYNRMLGNNFNFAWPKLLPGGNTLSINGDGKGIIEFTYRTPLKIGDCAIDISTQYCDE